MRVLAFCVVLVGVAVAGTAFADDLRFVVKVPDDIECLQRPVLMRAIENALSDASPSKASSHLPPLSVSVDKIDDGTRVTIRSGNATRVLATHATPCPKLGEATELVLSLWVTSTQLADVSDASRQDDLSTAASDDESATMDHRRFALQLRAIRGWGILHTDGTPMSTLTRSYGIGLGFFWRPLRWLEVGALGSTQFGRRLRDSIRTRTFDASALVGVQHTFRRVVRLWTRTGVSMRVVRWDASIPSVDTQMTLRDTSIVLGIPWSAGLDVRIVPSWSVGLGGSMWVIVNRDIPSFGRVAVDLERMSARLERVSASLDLNVTFEWGRDP